MSDSKHTPLPWKMHFSWDVTGYPCFYIHGLSGEAKRDEQTLQANTEYIVKCCNAYPKLVEALNAIVTEYDSDSATNQHLWTLIDKNAREALREAGDEL